MAKSTQTFTEKTISFNDAHKEKSYAHAQAILKKYENEIAKESHTGKATFSAGAKFAIFELGKRSNGNSTASSNHDSSEVVVELLQTMHQQISNLQEEIKSLKDSQASMYQFIKLMSESL